MKITTAEYKSLEVIVLDFKSLFHKVTDKFKEAFQHIQRSHDKLSIDDVASYIKKHTNTVKTSRHLLGIDLHEYTLKENSLHFILETKGSSSEKILSLTILTEGKPLFKYKSYNPTFSSTMTVSLPELAATKMI